ncbi:protein kinase [Thauera sp.]|jgi:serine/threonine protein kinase|uniref:protein kinase domain-containing protein n=1 Tax=Thauera sp. TaxID=1905334 RepID=UPI00261EECF1|nr:protein kinase [Thauera sp.]MCK6407625.1 protein kinase [Thauera sp.]
MAAVAVERIGKYEVRRPIGVGATSTVHLAWDPFRRTEVAIKRLRHEILADPKRGRLLRQLFLNEAAFAGKLTHPHIVRIHDALVTDEDAWLVMDHVPGGTLEDIASPATLAPFERVIEIVFKASRALDYAFHQGVTHRDIKPANILLMAPGSSDIRISDFGAALHTARETTQIAGVGSPAYMSPQQVREVPLDHRTDIYSLGVVMFQLLTGHLPFEQENSYSLLYSITHDTPPPPSELRPDVPEALDAIVRRATEGDIEHRYQSWSEFSHDLALAFRNRSLAVSVERIGDTGKFQALRAMRFFRRFADAELWEVIGLSRFERASTGTVIIKEGERGDAICFVLEGEVRVSKHGRLLEVLNPGDCFGEIAVFSTVAGVRSASVEAAADTALVSIRARALERASEILRMHFYQAFLEVLATRLSQASARIANL